MSEPALPQDVVAIAQDYGVTEADLLSLYATCLENWPIQAMGTLLSFSDRGRREPMTLSEKQCEIVARLLPRMRSIEITRATTYSSLKKHGVIDKIRTKEVAELKDLSIQIEIPETASAPYDYPLTALLGQSGSPIVDLKLNIAPFYPVAGVVLKNLRILELVSSPRPSHRRLKSTTAKSASTWSPFLRFLQSSRGLKSLCLKDVLPEASSKAVESAGKVELGIFEHLSNLEIHDEYRASTILLERMGRNYTPSLSNITLRVSPGCNTERFLGLLTSILTQQQLVNLHKLSITWYSDYEGSKGNTCRDFVFDFEHLDENATSPRKLHLTHAENADARPTVLAKFFEGPMRNVSLSNLRELEIGGEGDVVSTFISEEETVLSALRSAHNVEHLTLHGGPCCQKVCNLLKKRNGGLFTLFPSLETLKLVDVDFSDFSYPQADTPSNAGTKGQFTHGRNDGIHDPQPVARELKAITARVEGAEGSGKPFTVDIEGSQTRFTWGQFSAIKNLMHQRGNIRVSDSISNRW